MIGAQSSLRSSDESTQSALPSHIAPPSTNPPFKQVKSVAKDLRASTTRTSTFSIVFALNRSLATHIYIGIRTIGNSSRGGNQSQSKIASRELA